MPSGMALTVMLMQPSARRAGGQRVGAPQADAVDVDADPDVLARARGRPSPRPGRMHDRGGVAGLGVDRHDAAAQVGAGAQRVEEVEVVGRAAAAWWRASASRSTRSRSAAARPGRGRVRNGCRSYIRACPAQEAKYLYLRRESSGQILFAANKDDGAVTATRRAAGRSNSPRRRSRRCGRELPVVAERTVAAIIVEVPSYADAFAGDMGQNIRDAVRAGARRLPRAGDGGRGADAGTPIRAGAGGRLPARPRRGAQRPLDGRAAGGLPGRRPGLLAAHERHARSPAGLDAEHAGPVRRAGLRLHRPALRGQRRRAQPTSWRPPAGSASATWSGWPALLLAGRPRRRLAAGRRSGPTGSRRAR